MKLSKKTLLITLFIILAGVTYYFVALDRAEISTAEQQKVDRPDLPLYFSYPSGESGLSLIEPPVDGENLTQAFILIPAKKYTEYQESSLDGDAPATISIFVFNLPDDTATGTERVGRIARLQNWALDNQSLTLFDQTNGTPDIVELDGVRALNYSTETSYKQDIYLVSYKARVYMFVGQYEKSTDDIHKVFSEVIASVAF